MQTIIFTDNKRLSTDYSADKTQRLFAEKIDVNHILNTEVYQSHISRVRFWVVKSNLASQESLILEVCKNFVNRGTNSINFQLSITKICRGQETPFMQQKKPSRSNSKFVTSSRLSGYFNSSMLKTLQFPSFMTNLNKQSLHVKTNSSLQWSHNNDLIDEEKKAHQSQVQKEKEEIVTLKSICKKQFQISTLSDLTGIFMNKQKLYAEFNINEQALSKSKNILINYIFRQNDIQVGISVMSQGSRKYLQKAINIQISEAFNVHFNNRKQVYESTCLTENFNSLPKQITKTTQDLPKQTYHKVLLFLFSFFDLESEKTKPMSSIASNKEVNKYIQAIQQWRIKDEDINITEKLSKQYVLIKQEIQNQKNNFKNKLKIFEAIIGESVNVQKLLNEQKDMETTSTIGVSSNINQLPSSGALNDLNLRVSRKSELKSAIVQPIQPTTMSSSSNNSEFKRLKESFQMIRNIDNIINEQMKKIQNLKKYHKQVVKQKEQVLYKNAKSLNTIKKQTKNIKDEIQQKNIQFEYKSKKSYVQEIQKLRNFMPTKEAQGLLNNNIRLFKKIVQNQRTNKNHQKFLIQQEKSAKGKLISNNGIKKADENQNNYQQKKFMIRKQHKSFYSYNYNSEQNQLSLAESQQFNQINPSIFKSIQNQEQLKQQKLMKKRKQEVEHHQIWMNVQKQQWKKSEQQEEPSDMSNQKEMQLLMSLYQYYTQNNHFLKQAQLSFNNCKFVHNQKVDIKSPKKTDNFLKKANLNVFHVDASHLYTHLYTTQQSSQLKLLQNSSIKSAMQTSKLSVTSQINLQMFPLLNKILNPHVSESALQSQQCSVISEGDILQRKEEETQVNKLKKEGEGLKRITLENMVTKK